MNAVPPKPEPGPRRDPLRIWTIYDHPSDFPDYFILRPHDVLPGGIVVENGEGYACPDIEVLREHMRGMGLTCIPRRPEDDPIIVESWL